MKERIFEIGIFVIGGIGLLILFTLLYNGPAFIFYKILGLLHNLFH